MEHTSCRTQVHDSAALFASLTAVIWDEREALERMLFRLVELRLLLQSGAAIWLGKADDDLRAARSHLQTCEHIRVAAVADIAATLDQRPRSTLATLVGAAPDPWQTVLTEHCIALRTLVQEIKTAIGRVRTLLYAASAATHDVRSTSDHMADIVAQVNQQSVLATTQELGTPALAAFLA
jgi:hypothetical protein